jgi:uncharacterized protein
VVNVADNAEAGRYEARVDDDLAGFLQYGARPGLLALVHTEVDSRFEGQGVGGRLVRGALDDARAKGLAVLPFCPFVNGYLRRHPEDVELVPEEYRAQFDLGPPAALG